MKFTFVGSCSGSFHALEVARMRPERVEALVLLEPDTVKIARQCLAGIDTDRAKRAGLNRLLRAVSVLSPQVIAEGVETLLEAAILIEEGIELAQGYLWDRPRLL